MLSAQDRGQSIAAVSSVQLHHDPPAIGEVEPNNDARARPDQGDGDGHPDRGDRVDHGAGGHVEWRVRRPVVAEQFPDQGTGVGGEQRICQSTDHGHGDQSDDG